MTKFQGKNTSELKSDECSEDESSFMGGGVCGFTGVITAAGPAIFLALAAGSGDAWTGDGDTGAGASSWGFFGVPIERGAAVFAGSTLAFAKKMSTNFFGHSFTYYLEAERQRQRVLREPLERISLKTCQTTEKFRFKYQAELWRIWLELKIINHSILREYLPARLSYHHHQHLE